MKKIFYLLAVILIFSIGFSQSKQKVTHWIPLPEPPKE